MRGKVDHKALVTVKPIGERLLKKGDIVLCKVKSNHYLYLIKAVSGDRYLIGNNRGGINGWTSRNCIYGICVAVES